MKKPIDDDRATMTRQKAVSPYRLIFIGIAAGIVMLAAVAWLFFGVFRLSYMDNIRRESADHIMEISGQIKAYIQAQTDLGWNTVKSVEQSIRQTPWSTEDDMLALLRENNKIWGVSDIYLYTESGLSVDMNGKLQSMDSGAKIVREAKESKQLFLITESRVEYILFTENNKTIRNSPIMAVSIVKDLTSLLDELDISSFQSSAKVYLTQHEGELISRLNVAGASDAYNILSLFRNGKYQFFDEAITSYDDVLNQHQDVVFLYTQDGETDYVAYIHIGIMGATWHLIYTVPENVVNSSTNIFSRYIVVISLIVIFLLLGLTVLVFLVIYRSTRARYSMDIISRDRMLELLSQNTNIAVGLISTEREMPLYVTHNMEKIFPDGLPLVDIEKPILQFKNNAKTPLNIEALNKPLMLWDKKQPYSSEYLALHHGKTVTFYTASIYPIAETEREYIAVLQDATKAKEREEAMRSALQAADSANKAKTQFLSNMSHDIRTPMNAIVNMTGFALEVADNPPQTTEYLEVIMKSSRHLLHIINDLLDVSRIESGKVTVETEPFLLAKLMDDTVEIITPIAEQRRQIIQVDCGAIAHLQLKGDRQKLSQVVINLLNNAVKFTQEGGSICLKATEVPSLRSESTVIRIEVTDNGVGIRPEYLDRIFEPFERGDNNQVRKVEGSGLGLAICKSYVDLMGGTISVHSVVGCGTTFIVEIPFERDLESEPVENKGKPDLAAHAIDFIGKRALLVEDHDINRKIATMLLKKFGMAVESAENGQEAVNMFTSSQPGYYDIIYMDIQMPVKNGYDAAKEIRASVHPQAMAIPIVAMTANVFAEDIEHSRVAGMNAHIGKPIQPDELFTISAKYLDHTLEEAK